jgi:hypothetical protein
MDTDRLIAQLAGRAEPVQRLRPPWMRTALWLAFAIPPLVVVMAIHGFDVDLPTALANRRFVIEQVATLATALTAAVAAFASTVPGSNRKWFRLVLVPLAVWLLTVGAGCVEDWRTLGPAGLQLRLDTACLLPMVLIGLVPAVTMVVMLRHGAPLFPRLTLALGALATAAIVNFALQFFHFGDISLMVLVWHLGLVATLSCIAGFLGPRFLGWGRLFVGLPGSPRTV